MDISKYTHILILGTHTAISWAEILEVYKIPITKTHRINNLLFVDFSNYKKDRIITKFNKLGGTIKLLELIKPEEDSTSSVSEVNINLESIANVVLDFLGEVEFNPKAFVLNLYGNKSLNIGKLRLLISGKYKSFADHRLKVLGNIHQDFVNSATTEKALRKNGLELNLILIDKQLTLAKTIDVQNISFWSKLDYKKPARDMKIGMLPSKLARIMLNLANIPSDGGFWDPFCGLGTVIMQGQILDLYSYGSDINKEALRMAESNVVWLLKTGLVPKLKYRLFFHDITTNPKSNKILRDIAGHGRFDAIVTEPFLGKPRSKPFTTKRQVLAEWTKLKPLYRKFLRNASELINYEGRIVFIVPLFRYEKTNWYVPELEINKNRWKIVKFNTGKLEWKFKDSNVGRQVVVIEKI